MNRYERKMEHKRTMKRRRLIEAGFEERFLRGDKYWKEFYLSGRKGLAKDESNRRVRAVYRELLAVLADGGEDVPALQRAEYRKIYDYWWTVW